MKKILLVILVVLGILLPIKVFATNDYFETEYIPGEYIKKFKGGTGKYEQLKLIKRKGDSKIVYCTELWEQLSLDKYLSSYIENLPYYSGISEDTINKIKLISYFGYGYNNHTDKKWYAITQFMIWKITNPESEIYFTDTLNGNRIDKYTNEINEINNLINDYYLLPSINNNTYNLRYNEPLSITDTNNVLSKFEFTNTGDYYFNISGNTITYSTKKKGLTTVTASRKFNRLSGRSLIYPDSNGQDLFLPGNLDDVLLNINFNLPTIDFTVNKLDKDTGTNVPSGEGDLNACVFRLLDQDNKFIATSTLENNKIVFKNIGYGNYKIMEIRAGTGYLLNNELRNITIDNNHTSTDFYNQIVKGKINITKYLHDTLNNKFTLEKANFIVLNKDSNKVLEFSTDDYGKAQIELPFGTYTIKQVTGTKNYKYVDDTVVKITEYSNNKTYNFYDTSLVVRLKINNLDGDTLSPILEETEYIITNLDTNEEINIKTNDQGYTDEVKLLYGNYEIKQIKGPNNYLLNNEKVLVEINEDNYSYDNELVEVDIKNFKEKLTKKIDNIELDNTIENNNNTENIIDNNILNEVGDIEVYEIDEVPNTLSYSYMYLYFIIYLNLIFWRRYEKN